MRSSRESIVGPLALVAAVSLFSTIEIVSKNLQTSAPDLDPFLLVFVRFLAAAGLLLAIGLPQARRQGHRLTRRDIGLFFCNGLLGVACSISLFHIAILVFRNASSSAVVFSVNPVFVAVLSPFMNRESMTARKALAVALGACGVLCFALESGRFTTASALGMGIMLASAFFFAVSICFSRRLMSRHGPLLLMGFSALFGSLLVLPLALARSGVAGFGALGPAWRGVAYIAVAGTAAAYGLYYFGLSRTSAYGASMSFFLKPVLAVLLALVIRGEVPNRYTIGGTALILGGLLLAILVRIPSPQTAPAPGSNGP
ncbi:MAG: EamA family transporter [Lentisphaeria bacterium]|nr:EamA family transporter [Lentisphaeria bacterium]